MHQFELITLVLMLLYVPVAIYRIARLCVVYVKTGKLGNIDNTLVFSMLSSSIDEEKEGPRWKNFFRETHPVAILMDGMCWIVIALFIGLLTNIPIVLGIIVAIFLFILLLRQLRKRYAKKQEFVERLKGEWKDD